MELLATVLDSHGRRVVLTQERWAHIVHGHPELGEFRAEVMRAVREPTVRIVGRVSGEEWHYLEGVGPSRYIKVVVRFTGGRGQVITAFARRSMP